MQELVREYLNELGKKQKKHRRFRIVTAVFAVMVVAGVIWGLSRAGIATTGEPKCGKEDHQHTEKCYSDALNCGLEEGGGHQHTEACWQEESVLVCGQEENEEHQHTEECYQPETVLVCGQEESEGHTHGEECYTKQLSCGKEEHQHEEECYIDKSADVEEESQWTAQYEDVEWKETWGEDLVIAAQLQLDYKESIENYTVAEDGSHKGYTRYGQFAGDPYTDWDASFVNFCMYYAGLASSEMFPEEMNTADWYNKFVEADGGNKIVYLTADKDYEPEAGDIVFFEKENEETETQMGIVSSYNKENQELKVIEGNSDNQVKENTYDVNDEHISEYLKITDMEEEYKGLDEESEEATDGNEGEEGTETDKNGAESDGDNEGTGENNKDELTEGNEKTDGEEVNEEVPEEATVELTTEVDGTVITLSGPESSFEKDKNYSIQAEKIEDEETIATIEEAIDKEAEKQEKKVENYQAFDIKLLVDGEEVQPLGPVAVKFSGREVEKSVENEDTEVNVIHVDENTGETTDMEAAETEEKEVVIETEHFSVYVYVETTNIFGDATLTIEHWGKEITTIDGEADASSMKDTVFTHGGNGEKKEINVKRKDQEIYSTDTLTYPNGSYQAIKDISKVCKVGENEMNYTATKVWVSTNMNNKGKEEKDWDKSPETFHEYSLDEEEEIKITGNCLIRFWYTPKTAENKIVTDGYFYDYDVSDGLYYDQNGNGGQTTKDNAHKYIKIDEQGINGSLFEGTGSKLGIGQSSAGNKSLWVGNTAWLTDAETGESGTYNLNGGNYTKIDGINVAGKVPGIVQPLLSAGGNLQFNVSTPQTLFSAGEYSTEYVWPLGFKQNGDTYTLQYVNNDTNHDYTKLTSRTGYPGGGDYWHPAGTPKKTLSSNDFWPLDQVQNKDPHMGKLSSSSQEHGFLEENNGKWEVAAKDGWAPQSDDAEYHNWFFGMTYEVEFTVGDYTGPMEYYFRGDDDFWLFIDGHLAVDIGGIHSSLGQSINLREWMENKGLLTYDEEGKNKTHKLKVFYMERGATGSCCYMQFTLPKSRPVTIPTPGTTEYEVEKFGDDDGSMFRPTSITVQLVQSKKGTNEQTGESDYVKLDASNNWKKVWSGLPIAKGGKNGTEYEYSYKVTEINLPAGYEAILDDKGNLTNTLKPVSLEVEKVWVNDTGLEAYRPDNVTLRLYTYNEITKEYEAYKHKVVGADKVEREEYKDIILTSASADPADGNKWIGKFENLPQYRYSWNEAEQVWDASPVKYCVREMYTDENGNLQPVNNAGSIINGNQAGKRAGYKVDYSSPTMKPEEDPTDCTQSSQDNPGKLTVTNTLLTKFRIIKKGTDSNTPVLDGAVFSLSSVGALEGPKYTGTSDSNGVIQWKEIGNDNPVSVLGPGDYIMKETKAPVGYTLSDAQWEIHVEELGRATIKDSNGEAIGQDRVETDTNGELVLEYVFNDDVLYELPSTGGPGTYWYMFGGLLLMTTATLITYRKKRRGVLRS